MWSNKEVKNTKTTSSSATSSSGINSLVQGTSIEGTIKADSDIRIDGKLTGNLHCKGKVIVGPTGEIDGDIQCINAVIEGNFSGLLVVSELLHIKESAKVQGDVHTQKLIVQSGSIFNVSCKMGGQIGSEKPRGEARSIEMEKLSKVVTS